MAPRRWLRRFAVALAVAASAWPVGLAAQSLSADRCQVDEGSTVYQDAALRFVTGLLTQDAIGVYGQLSPDMKRSLNPERTSTLVRSVKAMVDGIGAPKVTHSYLVTRGGSAADRTVMCRAAADGAAPELGDRVFVSVAGTGRQAHVLVEAATPEKTMSFALWLVADATVGWLVQGLHVSQVGALGKTAADVRAMAQEQGQKGHLFNAAVLFIGASKLSNRGKYFQTALWQDIQQDVKAMPAPPELQGSLPLAWKIDAETFRVAGVEPTTIGGKFALLIRREMPVLADSKPVEDENRRLIAGFASKHPELPEVFDAIAVVTVETVGGKSVRIVESLRR